MRYNAARAAHHGGGSRLEAPAFAEKQAMPAYSEIVKRPSPQGRVARVMASTRWSRRAG